MPWTVNTRAARVRNLLPSSRRTSRVVLAGTHDNRAASRRCWIGRRPQFGSRVADAIELTGGNRCHAPTRREVIPRWRRHGFPGLPPLPLPLSLPPLPLPPDPLPLPFPPPLPEPSLSTLREREPLTWSRFWHALCSTHRRPSKSCRDALRPDPLPRPRKTARSPSGRSGAEQPACGLDRPSRAPWHRQLLLKTSIDESYVSARAAGVVERFAQEAPGMQEAFNSFVGAEGDLLAGPDLNRLSGPWIAAHARFASRSAVSAGWGGLFLPWFPVCSIHDNILYHGYRSCDVTLDCSHRRGYNLADGIRMGGSQTPDRPAGPWDRLCTFGPGPL
jgi:hypothetical protein